MDEPVVIDVTFRSASGLSLRDRKDHVSKGDLSRYAAKKETKEKAVEELRKSGFKIIGAPTDFGVSISGSPELVRKMFGEGQLKVPEAWAKWIESVRIPPPVEFY